MKLLLNAVGILLVIVGAVWFLQGTALMPGSPIAGQPTWAVAGGISFAVGMVLLITTRRRPD